MNCAGLALALAVTANLQASSGDIQLYDVSKAHRFIQTSVAPSTEDPATPWRFHAEILPTSGTSAATCSVQSPTLTLPNATNTPFLYITANNSWQIRQNFSDQPSLDAAFSNGSYTFSMPTVTAPATTFDVSLGVTGDAYPNTPSLTNTSWNSGDNLVIDPTQSFTFTWNSFTAPLPGAFIVASITGIPDQQLAATATSLTLPANSLPPGRLISAKLTFANPTTTDTTSVPGVTGQGGYTTVDQFTIQTQGPARGDFNGDGFTDYLLFNPSTRRTAIWYLQGNAFLGGTFGPTLPTGWVVACVADVNLDGKPDYVLYNTSTRRTAIWFLNNATFIGASFGPTLPAGWNLIAAADINGDGKPDYVLFQASTRRTAIWFLNGGTFTGGAYGPTLPSGWMLIDALDFNANNKPDYLLFNPSTRQSAIWYLNGTTFAGGVFGPTLPSGWTLQGAADFNTDTKPDYVLFQASTRRTAIWYLSGGINLTRSAYGPTVAAGYSLVFP